LRYPKAAQASPSGRNTGAQAAIKAVKRQLQAQGIKPYSLCVKEIRALADERLVADAKQIIATSPLFERAAEINGFGCADVRCEMTTIGYARGSTDGQTLDAQHAALAAAGAERVYAEKISGAVTDRKALAKAIAALTPGDTLVVAKLDRLARSTRDLLNTLAAIAAAGATFKSLGDPWCDTTTPHGRLMLTVLGGLAEFERHLILARTSEGHARAQARGVRFGRKLKLTVHQRQEVLERRARGEALVDIARSFNVSHSTISRLRAGVHRLNKKNRRTF
jgi:DNA invertase Pin-like site-specific DNA recombinase